MIDYLWLIPLFPLAGSAINGLLGRRLSKKVISIIACGSSGAALLVALGIFNSLLQLPAEQRHLVRNFYTWISSGDFTAKVEFLLDPLSAVMVIVVTGVGFVIHIYSIGYMHAEDGYYRFFSYMNLFLFSMLVLVLANNFLLMFVGWEGVGLCSYLLIGYYFDRRSAGDAGKKAFIVNRIGDVGFVLGVLLVFATFNSLDFDVVFQQIASGSERFPFETSLGILGAIGLLLFIGATGKSAQIPLYVWLPDAMEGPTPVSALIHAATMVTAGVYMTVRCSPIFSRSEAAMGAVAIIGILTALLAATIAVAQTDIKRVLAYSTVSQLGYMFVAVGVGACSAAMFHLMTHAFFKALLFLGAGSVIHAMSGEQDMMRMGGLRKSIPITYATMMIAALAISGIPPLAGFFSKDEILWSAWTHGHPIVWLVGFVVAGLTAFYMFRLIFLTFFGSQHFSEEHHHAHESPFSMTIPLVVLAVLSVVGGLYGLPALLGVGENGFFRFLEPSLALAYHPGIEELPHSLEWIFAGASVLIACLGIYLAFSIYILHPEVLVKLAGKLKGLHQLLVQKYYVDEIYDTVIIKPMMTGSTKLLWKGMDVEIIDGCVNGVGTRVHRWAHVLKLLQNGLIRSYAAWILVGAILILFYVAMARG